MMNKLTAQNEETLVANELFNLVKKGDLSLVKQFIESTHLTQKRLSDILLINKQNKLQWTALTAAISFEFDDITFYLLDVISEKRMVLVNHCDIIYAFLNSGMVPAASKNKLHILIRLIRMGSSVDHIDLFSGTTALVISAFNGFIDIITYLIDKSGDLDIQDRNGRTPIMMASNGNQFDTVLLFIRQGANVELKDNDGKKASDLTQNEEIIEILTLSQDIFMQFRLQDSVIKGKQEEKQKLFVGSGLNENLFEEWFDINLCSESIFDYYNISYTSVYGSLKEAVYIIDPKRLSNSLKSRNIFELPNDNMEIYTQQDNINLLERCEILKENIIMGIDSCVDRAKFKTIPNFDFSYSKIDSIAKTLEKLISQS